MAWHQVDQSLPRHRKTLRAVAALGCDRHKFMGHLLELWLWAIDNVPIDGSLGDLSDMEIAERAGWTARNPERFVGALVGAGFIDQRPEGRWLHSWEDYGGRLQERRTKERDRLREKRSLLHQQPRNVAPTTAGVDATTAGTNKQTNKPTYVARATFDGFEGREP